MSVHRREEKIFAALLVSITAGAIVLMVLGKNPPSAGAFSLSRYYRLDSIEEAVLSRSALSPARWRCIEIYYSGTKAGNIEQLASLSGLAGPEDISCHFVICNGLGGDDGQIQSTEKWQRQWSVILGRTQYDTRACGDPLGAGSGQTIRICIIADGKTTLPTDFQIKRAEELLEGLCKKFNIRPESIYYPDDWP